MPPLVNLCASRVHIPRRSTQLPSLTCDVVARLKFPSSFCSWHATYREQQMFKRSWRDMPGLEPILAQAGAAAVQHMTAAAVHCC